MSDLTVTKAFSSDFLRRIHLIHTHNIGSKGQGRNTKPQPLCCTLTEQAGYYPKQENHVTTQSFFPTIFWVETENVHYCCFPAARNGADCRSAPAHSLSKLSPFQHPFPKRRACPISTLCAYYFVNRDRIWAKYKSNLACGLTNSLQITATYNLFDLGDMRNLDAILFHFSFLKMKISTLKNKPKKTWGTPIEAGH